MSEPAEQANPAMQALWRWWTDNFKSGTVELIDFGGSDGN